MSKNNLIRKSDKKFIRTEKARIRRQFFDVNKQEEMINELYKRFVRKDTMVIEPKPPEKEVKKPVEKEVKLEKVKKNKVAKVKS